MNQLSPTLNNCFTVKFQQEIAKKTVKFKRNWKILISKRELVVKLIPNKLKKVSIYHFFAQRPGCLALKWFCLFIDLIYCISITQDKLYCFFLNFNFQNKSDQDHLFSIRIGLNLIKCNFS